jgi:hypothetical protein
MKDNESGFSLESDAVSGRSPEGDLLNLRTIVTENVL